MKRASKLESVSRFKVLIVIGEEMQQIQQWAGHLTEGYVKHTAEHFARCEALVELLEWHDCGSHGGFDRGQEWKDRKNLFIRWRWLLRKLPKIGDKVVAALKRSGTLNFDEAYRFWEAHSFGNEGSPK